MTFEGSTKTRDRYQLVDVREPWEWQAGRIEGAVLIPLNDVMAGAEQGQLDKERPGRPGLQVGQP